MEKTVPRQVSVAYRVPVIELNGTTTMVIRVTPAPAEPVFGKFSIFDTERRAHIKKRKTLLAQIDLLITAGYQQPHTATGIEAATLMLGLDDYDTTTLIILVEEFDREAGPAELIVFLADARHCTERTKRELAVFRQQLHGVNIKMAEAILDRLRLEAHPLFAYEDFSQMTENECEIFKTVVSFYRSAFEHWVPSHGKYVSDQSWITATQRQQALQPIPALTPKAVILIAENPDKHDDIIQYVSERKLTVIDAEALNGYLTSPSSAISNGFL